MIPDYQSLMRPALALLEDGRTHRPRDIAETLADSYGLTDEERARLLPSGKAKQFKNRLDWALSYLAQAGLTHRPARGHVRITDAGREALVAHPERITVKILETYPSYIDFRARKRDAITPDTSLARAVSAASAVDEIPPAASTTPTDLVEQAMSINRGIVEAEVLQSALALSPTGFEDLVIHLLERMGYGKAGSVERTSATGDAGIDGIISQDPLGLDRIYMQAKRYAEDRPIDRPRIHEFAGALLGKQGDRGVFITTSRFTRGAREEADRLNARIELIDGQKLAHLLVTYRVGVQEDQAVTLYRLDEDFFDSL